MEFWTMEGYAVGFKTCVAVVADRIKLGFDKDSGPVISGGSS